MLEHRQMSIRKLHLPYKKTTRKGIRKWLKL